MRACSSRAGEGASTSQASRRSSAACAAGPTSASVRSAIPIGRRVAPAARERELLGGEVARLVGAAERLQGDGGVGAPRPVRVRHLELLGHAADGEEVRQRELGPAPGEAEPAAHPPELHEVEVVRQLLGQAEALDHALGLVDVAALEQVEREEERAVEHLAGLAVLLAVREALADVRLGGDQVALVDLEPAAERHQAAGVQEVAAARRGGEGAGVGGPSGLADRRSARRVSRAQKSSCEPCDSSAPLTRARAARALARARSTPRRSS